MKKFLIICIVLLIVLFLGQIIYYKVSQEGVNKSSLDDYAENIENVEDTNNRLFVSGMTNLYNYYEPKINDINLQREFYKFINVDIPQIYKNIYNKNAEEIEEFYEQNKTMINEMHINNKSDFNMIAYQINNALNEKSNVYLEDYNIDTETITKINDNLITFKLNLIYDNGKQIQVAYTISEVNDNIIISSAQSIDELFKSYTGQVTKQEVLNKINEFIANIEDLRLNSTLKTENEKRQYFDLNKSTLENIGITSQDDYISITNQINVMKWKESDLQYEKYEVNSESAVNEEDYVSFELVIYYNYNCSLDLKVSLSNQKSITPNIKISSYKYENKVDDN